MRNYRAAAVYDAWGPGYVHIIDGKRSPVEGGVPIFSAYAKKVFPEITKWDLPTESTKETEMVVSRRITVAETPGFVDTVVETAEKGVKTVIVSAGRNQGLKYIMDKLFSEYNRKNGTHHRRQDYIPDRDIHSTVDNGNMDKKKPETWRVLARRSFDGPIIAIYEDSEANLEAAVEGLQREGVDGKDCKGFYVVNDGTSISEATTKNGKRVYRGDMRSLKRALAKEIEKLKETPNIEELSDEVEEGNNEAEETTNVDGSAEEASEEA